jgi:hypothetical protein
LKIFQIDLVTPQYHVGKTFKSSRQYVVVSAGSDVVVMGLIFTLGTPAQVGAWPKDMENTIGMTQDVLHIGHHLRTSARASEPSWKPNQFGFKSASKSRSSPHQK